MSTPFYSFSIGQAITGFQPGMIIKKSGDTINGFLKLIYPYSGNSIEYKSNENRKDSVIPLEEIKDIITKFLLLEKVPFEGKEKLMPLLAKGKITLFGIIKNYETSEILNEPIDGNVDNKSMTRTHVFSSASQEIFYVAKKNNQYLEIEKQTFKVFLKHLMFDCSDMVDKIGKKGYKFSDIIRIVKEYNRRFTSL